MDRLRSPGGCPWDAAQTHSSLLPYLLEEAYETVEAVETSDAVALKEELGDVLLQVVFHARVAAEHPDEGFDIDDVAGGIVDKLVSRHPHVFADGAARTPAEVEATWESLKRAEKGRTSAVDGVPLAQPALALASKLQARAERAEVAVDFVADSGDSAVDRVWPDEGPTEAELGDLLFALVARARREGIDPEAALRGSARRYADAVRAAEAASGGG